MCLPPEGGSYELNFETCFGFTLPFECANIVILRTPGADMSAWLGLFSVTSTMSPGMNGLSTRNDCEPLIVAAILALVVLAMLGGTPN